MSRRLTTRLIGYARPQLYALYCQELRKPCEPPSQWTGWEYAGLRCTHIVEDPAQEHTYEI